MAVSFKTVDKTTHYILQNPSTYTERDKNGKVVKIIPIQYTEGIPTIIASEQKKSYPGIEPTSIYIKNGIHNVSEDNIYLVEFMRKTKDNQANGGKVIQEIDVEKDEIYQLESYEKLDDARNHVRNADDNETRAMAMWFMGHEYIKEPLNKIKIALRKRVEADPKFVDEINAFAKEKTSDEKLLITLAINNDIIAIRDGRKVVWAESNETIFMGSQSGDIQRDMSVWLKTDEEGRQYAKLIAEKIKGIKKDKK